MNDASQDTASRLFNEALESTGARDPRDYYRDRLRDLKNANPDGYNEAVGYYGGVLIPSISSGDANPLDAWRAYGLKIAELTAQGRTVAIDATGRSTPYEPPGDPATLILHLPDGKGGRALLVGLPPEPTDPQMATYDWLVQGRRELRG